MQKQPAKLLHAAIKYFALEFSERLKLASER